MLKEKAAQHVVLSQGCCVSSKLEAVVMGVAPGMTSTDAYPVPGGGVQKFPDVGTTLRLQLSALTTFIENVPLRGVPQLPEEHTPTGEYKLSEELVTPLNWHGAGLDEGEGLRDGVEEGL